MRRNTIAGNDSVGIDLASTTATGGGAVEDNSISDTWSHGMNVDANGLAIRRTRIKNPGGERGRDGIRVNGNGNTVSVCTVTASGGHGFNAGGKGNAFEDRVATDASADGFHLTGTDAHLTRCRATLCSGEGLDDGGTGTIVSASTFLGNRLDVANDGSFAGFGGDNKFKTGGQATPPQVD